MGSRGLTPLAAMLLGSSADRVAGRSPGPVLIVRKKGNHMGLLAGLFHRS
jgi:nucleotide-binding universal stress UspA family protein